MARVIKKGPINARKLKIYRRFNQRILSNKVNERNRDGRAMHRVIVSIHQVVVPTTFYSLRFHPHPHGQRHLKRQLWS